MFVAFTNYVESESKNESEIESVKQLIQNLQVGRFPFLLVCVVYRYILCCKVPSSDSSNDSRSQSRSVGED